MDIQILQEKITLWSTQAVGLIPNIISGVVVLVVFVFLARFVRMVIRKGAKRSGLPLTVGGFLQSIGYVATIILGIMIVLHILGLDKVVTSVLAGVGVLGLALGFAFQNVAANFISGFIMAFNKHVEIGDVIEVRGQTGKILSTNLRATTMELLDGSLYIVPNKIIFEETVINYSDRQMRRVDIKAGVSYDADLAHVEKTVLVALQTIPEMVKERPINFLFREFGDSSITFEVRFWIGTNDYALYMQAQNDTIKAIKMAFDREKITIPYPTRTVYTSPQ
ncbi:MAG: small conductance mechanosensitive channel [Planctomycetota bacterium]|jgi:small conductance mechanosensitive channel